MKEICEKPTKILVTCKNFIINKPYSEEKGKKFFYQSLHEKCPNTESFWSVFSHIGLNTRKYGPEETPYLDTFHVVNAQFTYCVLIWMFSSKVYNKEINEIHELSPRSMLMTMNHHLIISFPPQIKKRFITAG